MLAAWQHPSAIFCPTMAWSRASAFTASQQDSNLPTCHLGPINGCQLNTLILLCAVPGGTLRWVSWLPLLGPGRNLSPQANWACLRVLPTTLADMALGSFLVFGRGRIVASASLCLPCGGQVHLPNTKLIYICNHQAGGLF